MLGLQFLLVERLMSCCTVRGFHASRSQHYRVQVLANHRRLLRTLHPAARWFVVDSLHPSTFSLDFSPPLPSIDSRSPDARCKLWTWQMKAIQVFTAECVSLKSTEWVLRLQHLFKYLGFRVVVRVVPGITLKIFQAKKLNGCVRSANRVLEHDIFGSCVNGPILALCILLLLSFSWH